MTIEKISEVPQINLAWQKSPKITIKADENPFQTNTRSNATQRVLLDMSHENKSSF